jgi:hypothetical protein
MVVLLASGEGEGVRLARLAAVGDEGDDSAFLTPASEHKRRECICIGIEKIGDDVWGGVRLARGCDTSPSPIISLYLGG